MIAKFSGEERTSLKKIIVLGIVILLFSQSFLLFTPRLEAEGITEPGIWSTVHHDNARTGYSESSVPNDNQTLWTFNGYHGYSAVIAEGKVFFGSYDKNIYALEANSGNIVWKFETGNWVVATPTIANGLVFVTSTDGYLYSLEANTGSLIWKIATGLTVQGTSVAISNGRVILAPARGSTILSLNQTTGETVWENTLPFSWVWSSPMIDSGIVFIQGGGSSGQDGFLFALDEDTGSLLWDFNGVYGNFVPGGSPSASNGIIIMMGSEPGVGLSVYALNEENGSIIWRYQGIGNEGAAAIAHGRAYVASYDGYLYSIDQNNGTLVWKSKLQNPFVGSTSSPAVADGKVLVGMADTLYCLDEYSGNVIWSYKTVTNVDYSAPAVADGKVYIIATGETGMLYAFGAQNPQTCALTVASAHGNPNPSVGIHDYTSGSSVTCSVNSPVTVGGTAYTCTGWTGTGSVPSSGITTSVTFTITQDSSITWVWTTQPLTVATPTSNPSPGTTAEARIEDIQGPNAAFQSGESAELKVTFRNTGKSAQYYLVEFTILGPPKSQFQVVESKVTFSYVISLAGNPGTSPTTPHTEPGELGFALLNWEIPSDAPAGSYSLDVSVYSSSIAQNKGVLLDWDIRYFLFSVEQGYSYAESWTFAFGSTGVHFHVSEADMDSPVFYGFSTTSYLWIKRSLEAANLLVGQFTPQSSSAWLNSLNELMDLYDWGGQMLDLKNSGDGGGADFLLLQFLSTDISPEHRYEAFLYCQDFVGLMSLNHWPEPGILIPYDMESIPVPDYWLIEFQETGTVVEISEPSGQNKLFLHVYDTSGNHVGINHNGNKVERLIPGSYYADIENTITVFIPQNISGFRYVVDSSFAENQIEKYTIKVVSLNGTKVMSTFMRNGTIVKGENIENILYHLSVSSIYGNVSGDGWYEKGSIANFTVYPTEISTGLLTSKVLVGWSGDVESQSIIGTIVVDSSKSVVAVWAESYTLLYLIIALIFLIVIACIVSVVILRRRQKSAIT